MSTLYPVDPCTNPVHITEETIGIRLRNNLLRECLPYLEKIEGSPSTNPMLRGLIAEVAYVTKKGNT